MRQLPLLLIVFLLLSACARQPLSPEQQGRVDTVGAVSLLGDEFIVDVITRSLLHKQEEVLGTKDWQVDASFKRLLGEGSSARKKDFRDFHLDPAALERALGMREDRWKRITGRQNQLLMELLFAEAEKQGIHYFFLIAPMESHENFPLHRGNMGIYCYDRALRHSKAYPYFQFDFTFWDVAARKKLFQAAVDPSVTEVLSFAECEAVAQMKEPAKELEGPVKQAMGLIVDGLFQKMGWGAVTPAPMHP
jgi:hypothetical protein